MILVGQFGHQVPEHVACRRESVQQKDGGILRIPGFAVEDFAVIDRQSDIDISFSTLDLSVTKLRKICRDEDMVPYFQCFNRDRWVSNSARRSLFDWFSGFGM